jgi:protein TonB
MGLLLAGSLASRAQAPQATPVAPPATFFTADFRVSSSSDSTAFCSEITFRDSLSGVARVYYPSGKLRQYVPYGNVYRHLIHGTLTTWYEDGQLCTKEEYLNGVRQGDLLTYYPNGVVKRQERYEKGLCGVGKCYGPNGAPVPYFAYEQLPLYPGGEEQLLKELKRAVRLTSAEQNAMRREIDNIRSLMYSTQRQVDVELAVAADGRVTNARVVASTARYLNAAALRAVTKLQRSFVPGRRDGQTMASFITVPVYYTVQVPPRDAYRPNQGYRAFRQQQWR